MHTSDRLFAAGLGSPAGAPGGLRIDADARVLDRDDRPIARLYAAGADAGGVFHAGYGGGLGMSLVPGRRAARTVMAEMRARRSAAPSSR